MVCIHVIIVTVQLDFPGRTNLPFDHLITYFLILKINPRMDIICSTKFRNLIPWEHPALHPMLVLTLIQTLCGHLLPIAFNDFACINGWKFALV